VGVGRRGSGHDSCVNGGSSTEAIILLPALLHDMLRVNHIRVVCGHFLSRKPLSWQFLMRAGIDLELMVAIGMLLAQFAFLVLRALSISGRPDEV